jgi:hypothetical protein
VSVPPLAAGYLLSVICYQQEAASLIEQETEYEYYKWVRNVLYIALPLGVPPMAGLAHEASGDLFPAQLSAARKK